MKRVVVIGSNSFSGSDFIDLLLEEGKYEVIGISRSPEKSSLFLPYKKRDLYGARLGCLDLDSAKQSQMEAKRLNEAAETREGPVGLQSAKQVREPNRDDHSRIGKADEEDPFGKVAASPNSQNLCGCGIKNFRFFQIDLNKDMDSLNLLLDEFQPDYVVNFAAQSEVAPSWKYPHHWFQTNAVAITQLANLLKDKKFLKRYVHISSPEVYGTCEGNVTEEAPLNPSTPYAASKAAGDLSLFTFYKNFSFPLVMIRSTNVYGAHQQLFKIIPRSAIYLKQGKTIELHGGGNAVKSYIHIRDISKGTVLLMESGRIGQIYHLSPDSGVEVKTVVRLICEKVGIPFIQATRTVEERLGQDKAYVIDSTKARTELGWAPTISLEEGVGKVIDWVSQHYLDIQKLPLDYIHIA